MCDAGAIHSDRFICRGLPSFSDKQFTEPGFAAFLQSILHHVSFHILVSDDVFQIDIPELCYGD